MFNKEVLKHLAYIVMAFVALLLLILLSLRFYTRHGETQKVPDVLNLHVDKAIQILEDENLGAVVVDSVFAENTPKMGIVDQNPRAGQEVKKGRKIYLVVNSLDVPMVEMPDLAGKTSLRQAKNILEVKGFKLGKIIERPDPSVLTEHDQPVLEQLYRNERIIPGTEIKKFSVIDLVIGVKTGGTDSLSMEEEFQTEEF